MAHRDLLMCIALLATSVLQQGISGAQDTRCNGSPSTDWSCCDHDNPCNEGGGDCDRDSDCIGSLKCGNNNCRNEFSSDGSNWSSAADCCFGMHTTLYKFNTCSLKRYLGLKIGKIKFGILRRDITIFLLQTLLKIVKDLLPLIGIAVRMPFRVCLEVEIVTMIHNVLEILFVGLIIAAGTFRHLTVIG